MLDTGDIALEGWVYQKIDEVIAKMGKSIFDVNPVQVDTVANIFNEKGWEAIFNYLINHLKLTHVHIEIVTSDSKSTPGTCHQYIAQRNNVVARSYKICINKMFLDNPFSITVILAHELCHVIYYENFEDLTPYYRLKTNEQTLEGERIVDLLIFMFKLGEFQLRVSRDKRITFGYFNQEIFERMQVIVSRKF